MSDYHYTECGLDNVFVYGCPVMEDDKGEEVFMLKYINSLHRVIAQAIVNHSKGISGKELRFLRSELGLTQSELARFVHKDGQTIGRWERGEGTIDSPAEAMIRVLTVQKLKLSNENDIEEMSRRSVQSAQIQPIDINFQNNDYELREAA
ncbi:MAG: helix-turn-helix domain-containing protein [Alphaproteobacteria bacterium]